MEVVSIIISGIGVLLSVFALTRANSAQKTARRVLKSKDNEEDKQRLRELIATLNDVKGIALRKRDSSNFLRNIGLKDSEALTRLSEAEDALRTKLPIAWNQDKRVTVEAAATDINAAIETIRSGTDAAKGWQNAVVVLQRVIPQLEREERSLTNAAIYQEP